MSGGTHALIARFLATASERLTQMGEVLAGMRAATDIGEVVKRFGRDLHTLKGEARLLGLPEIERVAHASEDMLFSHHRAKQITERTEQLLYEAIDMIFTSVQARGEGAQVNPTEIDDVIARLRAAVIVEAELPTDSATADMPAGSATAVHAQTPSQVSDAPNRVANQSRPQPSEHTKSEDPVASGSPPVASLGRQAASSSRSGHLGPDGAANSTAPPPERRDEAQNTRTMRIPAALLDTMTGEVSNLSGSLVRNRQYLSALADLVDELRNVVRDSADTEKRDGYADREALSQRLLALPARLTTVVREFREHHFRLDLSFGELAETIRASRLQPLRTIFATYPTFVRNAARQEGKRIRVEISGDELGIDQRVLDEIAEPCLHLLRNSVAHGIGTPEQRQALGKRDEGLITISARKDGEFVRIEFTDDGRGIDLDRVRRRAIAMGAITEDEANRASPAELVRLVFISGLSTAASTTELAGRGVGLDVVASVIDRMGGTVTLESIPSVGTKFIMQVPVSLSLTRALFLEASDQVFAVPNAAVVEVYRLAVKEIRTIEGHETTTFRGKLLPLVRLREALGLTGIKDIFVNKVHVVVLRVGSEMAGFLVDNLIGEREIVTRPFGAYIGRSLMSSGVTVMENGDVVLILHPLDLLRSLHDTRRARARTSETRDNGGERRILYAEDSIITREYAAGVLRSSGFTVVEASDGVEALELLQREAFDLLLTDLQMPRLDGFKLCALVRKDPRLANLPIVVMSTLDTPETKRMALDAGADAYLVKANFAADTLVAMIGNVIR